MLQPYKDTKFLSKTTNGNVFFRKISLILQYGSVSAQFDVGCVGNFRVDIADARYVSASRFLRVEQACPAGKLSARQGEHTP